MNEREFAVEVTRRLQDAGHEALWAGGCVRDQLLGLDPKDYDVATSARPEQVQELFGRHRSLAIGASFGVITILGPEKSAGQIEVATFRNDGDYSDGRRPDSVEYSTAEEDAQRRDFTINGLFFDPIKEQVIDFVGGREDLKRRVIRAIGDAESRIDEDKLRMLRAVRFTATFDFDLEVETARAIERRAEQINVVSRERVAAEFRRMFSHPQRSLAVKMLSDLGLLHELLDPELRVSAKSLAWPGAATLERLKRISTQQFSLALAMLLRDLLTEPKSLEQLGRNWKLSVDEIRSVIWLIENESSLLDAVNRPWPQIQRRLIQPLSRLGLEFCEVIANHTKNEAQKQSMAFCRTKLSQPPEVLNPEPLLTGDDLNAAGLKPGPKYKLLLDSVRDAQLEGKIANSDQALELARELDQN